MPLLRVNIRRRVVDAAIRKNARALEQLSSIATVRLENGVFQPRDGYSIATNGHVRLHFSQPDTLQIVVHPLSETRLKGIPVVLFAATAILVSDLGIEVNAQACALVGDMSHTPFLGELSIAPVGGSEGGHLSPRDETLPFALPLPPLAA